MKKISYIILIVVCLWMSGCDSFDVDLKEYQIGFCIDNISFGGDWSHYNSIGVNNLYVEIDMEEHHNTPVKLNMAMSYNADNVPNVSVPDGKYVLDGDGTWYDHSTLKVDSDFQKKSQTKVNSIKKVSDDISLHNEYYYKIDLKYNADNNSVLDLELESDDGEWNWVPNGLNFVVDYDVVHDGTSDGPKLNLIVMAEGYRADQMDDYKAYVKRAFTDTSTFHQGYYDYQNGKLIYKHIPNDFFTKYWSKIRIIRMDTVSPQSGIDYNKDNDDIQTILNYNKASDSCYHAADFIRLIHIMNMTKPKSLWAGDVDAYIIFVNADDFRSYTFAYDNEVGYKFGQPIHPVFIGAYAGCQDITSDYDYYQKVHTYAIAHELGHALARLKDEYYNEIKDVKYEKKFRNIDDGSNTKWQIFIKLGFDNTINKRDCVGYYKGAMCNSSDYYRSTDDSTMRQGGSYDIQFGPVNTYHLTASLKIRIREILHAFDLTDGYGQWDCYSVWQFKEEWYKEYFGDKTDDS